MEEKILEELKRLREEQERINVTRLADVKRLCAIESRMTTIDNVFNDLKNVEKESQFLLQPIEAETYPQHDDFCSAFKHFCCFCCL
jgi:hypothetical protein